MLWEHRVMGSIPIFPNHCSIVKLDITNDLGSFILGSNPSRARCCKRQGDNNG